MGVFGRTEKKIHAKVGLPNKEGKKLTGIQLLNVIEQVATKTADVHTGEFCSYNILDQAGWFHLKVIGVR